MNEKNNNNQGICDIHKKGYGFVRTEDGKSYFLSPTAKKNALTGDKVIYKKIGENKGDGEAQIIKILEHTKKNVLGVFRKNKSYGFIITSEKYGFDVFVPPNNEHNAKNGDVVIGQIYSYKGKNPSAEIIEVIGKEEDADIEIKKIIKINNIREHFPRNVLNETNLLPNKISAVELKNRKDYRNLCVVTIDGDDSKDFDDAVYLKKVNDLYYLQVHIADVSHYVKQNSPLDKEALLRGTSYYFVDRVIPMLPQKISNGICSLNPNQDRLTLSTEFIIDNKGNVLDFKIQKGVINSKKRLTYNNVNLFFKTQEIDAPNDIKLMLNSMYELSTILYEKRRRRGNIEFDIPECKITLDYNKKPIKIIKYERGFSQRLIEEFMLTANECVAKQFSIEKIPFVFRVHEPPSDEKLDKLLNILKLLGVSLNNAKKPTSLDISQMLANIDEKYKSIVNNIALRSMMKAFYSPENKGHFGIAATYYCHFTSPIRRYPDLMIHRIISDYLLKGVKNTEKYQKIIEEVSIKSSINERNAEESEREIEAIMKAEYMKDKYNIKFKATVTSVTEWGIYVELYNTVEGMIRKEDLPKDDYFVINDLKLQGSKNVFKIGDELNVHLKNVLDNKISFELCD